MATIEFTKTTLVMLGVINGEDEMTDDAFNLFSSIALDRLQALLCDSSLTLKAFPVALIPLLQDLFVWAWKHNPESEGIKSETTENYSYSKSDAEEANYLVRLRSAYADLIKRFSSCGDEGAVQNAHHNPLWTPDYYREAGGVQ